MFLLDSVSAPCNMGDAPALQQGARVQAARVPGTADVDVTHLLQVNILQGQVQVNIQVLQEQVGVNVQLLQLLLQVNIKVLGQVEVLQIRILIYIHVM